MFQAAAFAHLLIQYVFLLLHLDKKYSPPPLQE